MNAIFAFEGQGSVIPGMGKKEYERNDIFRKRFDEVCNVIGEDIREICWGKERFKLKSNPYYAHLAIFAGDYALFHVLLEKGYEPLYLIGHSLGEILAIIIGGALSLEEGASLIKLRGRLFWDNMNDSNSEMVALIGNSSSLERVIVELKNDFEIYIANENTPKQIVISCSKKDINNIIAYCLSKKVRPVKLGIGNGCHSPLVKSLEQPLNELIEDLTFRKPKFKIFSCSFVRELDSPEEIKQYTKKHLLTSVKFRESMTWLWNKGCRNYIVIGFSKVVKGLILENYPHAKVQLGTHLMWGEKK